MLIEKYLPEYHFNEIHSIKINASTNQVIKAIKELRIDEIHKIMEILTEIRALPHKLKGIKRKSLNQSKVLLDTMYQNKFFLLDENKNEIVIGLIGKFWKLSSVEEIEIQSADYFLNFDDDKFGIIACNMLFTSGRLFTETRIFVGDKNSRSKFRIYWFAIRLGSGLIRRVWLKAIKRKAENYNKD